MYLENRNDQIRKRKEESQDNEEAGNLNLAT